MKATCTVSGDNVIYRLSDYDPVYEEGFRICFYEKDEAGYFKSFPLSYPYTEQVMRRFESYAKEMFDQILYRTEIPWEEGLEAFCRRVEGTGLSWWLTGSCASCIRGAELNPHDVDIMIESSQCRLVEELFADELIEPLRDTTGWVTKDFGVIFLKCRIDIASDPSPVLDQPDAVDCGPYALAHLEMVQWRGFEILVPTVQLQINANRRRGRLERVEALEALLRQGGK